MKDLVKTISYNANMSNTDASSRNNNIKSRQKLFGTTMANFTSKPVTAALTTQRKIPQRVKT